MKKKAAAAINRINMKLYQQVSIHSNRAVTILYTVEGAT